VRYLSVCSGIEAATEAWHELGWLPEAFSEIEPFPCAVLKHHYPEVPNLGDMTKFKEWNIGPIDLLVGGTPCQSFSVAGLREGLADPRGDLMLTFLAIARRHRPRWLVWENVPGVLSSNGGEDFACLLRGLAELGYGFAYRVLDAQHFGVAQRRRRVFVVGYLGDWHPAAAVLLERSSLSGHPAPSREKRQGATPSPVPGVANCLTNRMHKGINTTVDEGQTPIIELPEVMCTLRSSGAGFDRPGNASTEHETYIPMAQAIPLDLRNAGRDPEKHDEMNRQGVGVGNLDDPSHTLTSACVHGVAHPMVSMAMRESGQGYWMQDEIAGTLRAEGEDRPSRPSHVIQQEPWQVRRLTPRECERLQGFPDDYTAIPWRGKEAPDGPRYKALGNSMAVPVMRWIGKRIQQVEKILDER
jgi:DNA (cytosine-5)-methyltransferase 1